MVVPGGEVNARHVAAGAAPTKLDACRAPGSGSASARVPRAATATANSSVKLALRRRLLNTRVLDLLPTRRTPPSIGALRETLEFRDDTGNFGLPFGMGVRRPEAGEDE